MAVLWEQPDSQVVTFLWRNLVAGQSWQGRGIEQRYDRGVSLWGTASPLSALPALQIFQGLPGGVSSLSPILDISVLGSLGSILWAVWARGGSGSVDDRLNSPLRSRRAPQ